MPKIIEIDGIIGWDILPSDVSRQLKEANGEDVEILFSSDGGFISDGLAIFNHIKDYQGKTTSIIIGMAASMASYIPLASDKVIAKSNAVFMIHDALMGIYGNQAEHEKAAKILGGFSNLLADIYVKKTKKTHDEIRALMQEETFFFGPEILEAGFVDEIDDIEIGEKSRDDFVLDAMMKAEISAERMKTKPEDFNKIAAYLPKGKSMSKIIAGESLGAFLNGIIDDKAGDDIDERQSIISEMARAAGIEVNTVEKILSGSIICPPISRLRAFSRVLDVTISRIIDAAEKDGCNYNEEEDVMSCNIKNQASEPVKKSVQRSSAQTESKQEVNMSLDKLLAEHPEAKKEHDALIEAAEKKGADKVQAKIEAVSPFLKSNDYTEVHDECIDVIMGKEEVSTVKAMVKALDKVKALHESKEAKKETDKNGETFSEKSEKSTDGKLRNAEDEEAAISELKGV